VSGRAWLLPVALAALAALVGFGPAQAAARPPRHQLILISLDGFRWDYLQRPNAARLRALAAGGTRAERLVPAFPSKTFPNHITLVTGLYPEHHGIAANVMRDPVLGRFATGADPAVRDPRWYTGEPIWVTAERQGVRSASYFWPGSEAPIGGVLPHWTYPFDVTTTRATRVERVLEWVAMPETTAPGLIAVYFSEVDTDGHNFGPNAARTDTAIAQVDSAVGAIVDGIARLGATDRVNIVVVSDHGMTEIVAERTITLDSYVSMDSLVMGDWSPVATIIPKAGTSDYVFNALVKAHPHMKVYRKGDLPDRLHYNTGAHVTPIVAIADEGWSIATQAAAANMPRGQVLGAHGYDPELPSMGALFIAAGPDVARGLVVPPFGNVHVHALLAQLLHLTPPVTDGSLDSVRLVLRATP
jgi:predicted AlkP superfamily pyrophosphatase or phosphodiesterase